MARKRSTSKERMAVYLDPDIKAWWECQAEEFGCAASTFASQLLTVAAKRCVSPADALAAVASHCVLEKHVTAQESTYRHDTARHVSARIGTERTASDHRQPSTLPLVHQEEEEEEEEEEESPPPTNVLSSMGEGTAETEDLLSRAGQAEIDHRMHNPKSCPFAADPYASSGQWCDMFGGPATKNVVKQAHMAVDKAARCDSRSAGETAPAAKARSDSARDARQKARDETLAERSCHNDEPEHPYAKKARERRESAKERVTE